MGGLVTLCVERPTLHNSPTLCTSALGCISMIALLMNHFHDEFLPKVHWLIVSCVVWHHGIRQRFVKLTKLRDITSQNVILSHVTLWGGFYWFGSVRKTSSQLMGFLNHLRTHIYATDVGFCLCLCFIFCLCLMDLFSTLFSVLVSGLKNKTIYFIVNYLIISHWQSQIPNEYIDIVVSCCAVFERLRVTTKLSMWYTSLSQSNFGYFVFFGIPEN